MTFTEEQQLQHAIRQSLEEEKLRKNKQVIAEFKDIYEHECKKCNNSTFLFTKLLSCPVCNDSTEHLTVDKCEANLHPSKPRAMCIRPTLSTFADYKPEESLLHCGIAD